jgi:predicted RNase H-like nuclease (RuvC/YqgF family)
MKKTKNKKIAFAGIAGVITSVGAITTPIVMSIDSNNSLKKENKKQTTEIKNLKNENKKQIEEIQKLKETIEYLKNIIVYLKVDIELLNEYKTRVLDAEQDVKAARRERDKTQKQLTDLQNSI